VLAEVATETKDNKNNQGVQGVILQGLDKCRQSEVAEVLGTFSKQAIFLSRPWGDMASYSRGMASVSLLI